MEFTIWSESSQSDKNDGPDLHGTGGPDEFSGALNSMTSPPKDSSDSFKAKSLAKDPSFDFNDFNEQDVLMPTWNMVPSEMGSVLSQDQQGLTWDDDFSNFGVNDSIDGSNAPRGASFDGANEAKDLIGGDSLGSMSGIGSDYRRQYHHKRDLSDTYTMRVPLVSRSHNDTGDDMGQDSSGMNLSPEMLSDMMQTPVRNNFGGSRGQNFLLDGLVAGSPDFGGSRLDSPLESPALQSPYLAYQPFPMLPTTSHVPSLSSGTGSASTTISNPTRKFSNAGSPTTRRKSSSASQNSMTSPIGHEALEAHQQVLGPQTPRARANTGNKNKHKKSASSVAATPKSSSASKAGGSKHGNSNTDSPAASLTTTPRASSNLKTPGSVKTPGSAQPQHNQTQTPTPAREGKKDGRKRIAKEQIDILEAAFQENPRPEREDRVRLAAETSLEQRTVQIWFQNRRAKSRAMKMPPSQADTSVSAMQFRAAVAAASNAVANSSKMTKSGHGSPPAASPRTDFNLFGNNGISGYGANSGLPPNLQRNNSSTGSYSRTSSMTQMSPLANSPKYGGSNYNMAQPFPARPPHQRWNSVSVPATQPLVSYHQQLPKNGVSQGAGVNSPIRPHQFQQMDQMQQMQMDPQSMMQQTSPLMQNSFGSMSQLSSGMMSPGMSAMSPPLNRSNSSSRFEPYHRDFADSDLDFLSQSNGSSAMNGRALNRSDSILSLASVNSTIPPSPLSSDNMGVFGADLRTMQTPQESKNAWQGLARNHSLVTLSGNNFDHTAVTPGSTDVKRRRSLYSTQVPNWNAHYDDPLGSSLTPSRLSPTNHSDSYSSGSSGSLAASAAAAALRTRNRSHTQPAARSRQPSIRLQLDESNNAAQLVVLPDDQDETMASGSKPHESHREMSPGRAERAAEKLLAERAASATMKYGQSSQNE